MYILSLHDGYAIIEKKDENYYLTDYEGGMKAKIKVGRTQKSVLIIPTGQIVIDQFNNSWMRYKNAGGKRRTAMQHGKWHISDNTPVCPKWIYPNEPPKSFDLRDIDAVQGFIETAFIPYMGTLVPVFEVNSLSELYFYDLFRVKTENIPIAQCAECGRAYRKVTTRKYCDVCSARGISQKKKQENLKSDVWSSTYKKIRDRASKDVDKPYIYKGYSTELLNMIDAHRDACRTDKQYVNGKDTAYISAINRIDKAYRKLCKHYDIYDYDADEWQKIREQFLMTDSPEEWLKSEYEKAGLKYPAE